MDKISESELKKQKEKKIKKLKRVHILPHTIIFLIYILIMSALILVMWEMLVASAVRNKVSESGQRTEPYILQIEKLLAENTDTGDCSVLEANQEVYESMPAFFIVTKEGTPFFSYQCEAVSEDVLDFMGNIIDDYELYVDAGRIKKDASGTFNTLSFDKFGSYFFISVRA